MTRCRRRGLRSLHATVDIDGLSGEECCCRVGEEGDGGGDLSGVTGAPDRDGRSECGLGVGAAAGDALEHVGLDRAWADGVDADAVGCWFKCCRAGQADDGVLAGDVERGDGEALVAVQRGAGSVVAFSTVGLASELGYRYPEPNRLQRLVQSFASSRFGAWLTPKTLVPLDRWTARLTHDRVSLPVALAALPVVTLVTTGRKSGLSRQHHLIAIPYQDDLALMGTNFGQARTPAWTLNLDANSRATVSYGGVTRNVSARLATPGERTDILATVATKFSGAAHYEQRLRGRRAVPVVVLEAATD
jgi:deazaflavin-dependent oxidoreductase (nitroreductase family)